MPTIHEQVSAERIARARACLSSTDGGRPLAEIAIQRWGSGLDSLTAAERARFLEATGDYGAELTTALGDLIRDRASSAADRAEMTASAAPPVPVTPPPPPPASGVVTLPRSLQDVPSSGVDALALGAEEWQAFKLSFGQGAA